jgi:hypothetical protein
MHFLCSVLCVLIGFFLLRACAQALSAGSEEAGLAQGLKMLGMNASAESPQKYDKKVTARKKKHFWPRCVHKATIFFMYVLFSPS